MYDTPTVIPRGKAPSWNWNSQSLGSPPSTVDLDLDVIYIGGGGFKFRSRICLELGPFDHLLLAQTPPLHERKRWCRTLEDYYHDHDSSLIEDLACQ